MIYLDTSAVVKLVSTEPETEALAAYLRSAGSSSSGTVFTSALTRTELVRAASRHGSATAGVARQLVDTLTTVPLREEVLDDAGRLSPGRNLRSLDAIHLTCALRAGPRTVVVTYDDRMAEAAEAHGLAVARPGLTPRA